MAFHFSRIRATVQHAFLVTFSTRLITRYAGCQAVHLESWPPWHGHNWTKLYVRLWTLFRHAYTCLQFINMYIHVMYMYIYLYMVCKIMVYIHVHAFLCLYVRCTYIYIDVDTCLDTVQALLCSFTTTLHFLSGQISLVPQARASLSSAQELLLLSSLLHGTSLFNWQTTQALLATPKLPQPRVHLIHFAATPAIRCCSVTAAHLEARPLVLLYCSGMVGVKLPARNKGISGTLPTMLRQLNKTCMYIAYMCTYSVHGYHILYAYTTTVFATAYSLGHRYKYRNLQLPEGCTSYIPPKNGG